MLWVHEPIQARHMVVSFEMTGEIWFMLISARVTGRKLRPPERVDEVDDSERKDNPELRTMRIFAARINLY